METYEQKKRRLFGKQYLSSYLIELNKILKINVDSTNLSSIVEMDDLKRHFLAKRLKSTFKILFDEKEKLKEIVLNNTEKFNDKYYVLTSYSMDCGIPTISSLYDFNFDFAFKDIRSGIITLIRTDLLEEIILDFSEECEIEYLEIEIYIRGA